MSNNSENIYLVLPSSQLFPFSSEVMIAMEAGDTEERRLAKQALSAIANGNYDQAMVVYTQAITNTPELPFFYACRSILNTYMGDEEGAFYDYQVAKRLDFNYHNFLEWRESAGLMEESEELREINQQIQVHTDVCPQLYVNRAMLQVQHFNYLEAIADFTQALQSSNPPVAKFYLSRGAVQMRTLQYDRALKDFESAFKLDDQDSDIYLYKAKLYIAIREYAEALDNFERALLLSPHDDTIYEERANFYEHSGEWAKAIGDYTTLITLRTEDFYSYVLRADAYVQQGLLHEAIADYDRAIVLNPYYSDLFQYRGELKEKMGDMEGAKKDFEKYESLEEE